MAEDFPSPPHADFRLLADWPGYGVDADGNIWSCRKVGRYGGINPQWMKLATSSALIYRQVRLRRDGQTFTRYVHRLVLEAFVGPCPQGMECCHIDGNAGNNAVINLRWGTSSANKEDKRRHGTLAIGERVYGAKLNAELVRRIFVLRREGKLQREIAEAVGCCRSQVSTVLSGKNWRHLQAS